MPLYVSSLACALCFATILLQISGHCHSLLCPLLVICYMTVKLPTLQPPRSFNWRCVLYMLATPQPELPSPNYLATFAGQGKKNERRSRCHLRNRMPCNACPFRTWDSLLLQEESLHHPKGSELCRILSVSFFHYTG